MKKPIEQCESVKDFLLSNYDRDDLSVFADDIGTFMYAECNFSIARNLYHRFKGDIFVFWQKGQYEFHTDSWYAAPAQQVMVYVQEMCQQILDDHENKPCAKPSFTSLSEIRADLKSILEKYKIDGGLWISFVALEEGYEWNGNIGFDFENKRLYLGFSENGTTNCPCCKEEESNE